MVKCHYITHATKHTQRMPRKQNLQSAKFLNNCHLKILLQQTVNRPISLTFVLWGRYWGPSKGHGVPAEDVSCTGNIPSHHSLLSLSQPSYLSYDQCISEITHLNLFFFAKNWGIWEEKYLYKTKVNYDKSSELHTHTYTKIPGLICAMTVSMHCFVTFYVHTISYFPLSSALSLLQPGLVMTSFA